MSKRITKDHIANAKKPTGENGTKTLQRMNISHEELTNWALSFLKSENTEKILDIGCGGGATIRRLLKKYPKSFVHGIDYSKEGIELSRKLNNDILDTKCDIIFGDVHDIPFDDESFDLVTAFETVYFWNDLPKAFGEAKRVLKKNGEFLICCESSNIENEIWQDVLDELRILNAEQWKEELEKNGFIVKCIEEQGEWINILSKKN